MYSKELHKQLLIFRLGTLQKEFMVHYKSLSKWKWTRLENLD